MHVLKMKKKKRVITNQSTLGARMRLSAKLLSSLSKLNSRGNENKRRFLAYCRLRIQHANYDFYS